MTVQNHIENQDIASDKQAWTTPTLQRISAGSAEEGGTAQTDLGESLS
jgi:hypothetical protein